MADFVPGVGNLTRQLVKSPIFPPHPGVGHVFDKCIELGKVDGLFVYRMPQHIMLYSVCILTTYTEEQIM